MRTLFHILVGALGGFALGILAPVALFFLMYWIDPKGMSQGGGTPFAFFMIVTIPFGTAAGIVWGFLRANPGAGYRQEFVAGKVIKGSDQALAEIQTLVSKLPVETQPKALSHWLVEWLDDYRAMMKTRTIWTTVFALITVSSVGLAIIVLVIYLSQTAAIVMRTRKRLDTVRSHWGNDVVDRLGELPRTLRPIRALRY